MKKTTQKSLRFLCTAFFLALLPSGICAADTISITSAPKKATASKTVSVEVAYTKEEASDVWVQVRLMDGSGAIVIEGTKKGQLASCTLNFQMKIPSDATGEGYRWHTQMFNSDWSKLLVDADGCAVTVEAFDDTNPPNPGKNTLAFDSEITTVTAGSTQKFNVNYTQNTDAPVWVQVRLMDASGQVILNASGDKIEDTKEGTEASGILSFSLDIPATISGTDYQWHTQMFNNDWSKQLVQEYRPGITVEKDDTSGTDSATLVETPEDIEAGKSYPVTVSYMVNQPSIIHVQLFDKVSPPWNKIGQVFDTNVPTGSGTVTLQVPIDLGQPSANNRLEVLMYEPTDPWTPIAIEIPFANISGVVREVVFGACPDNPGEVVCYEAGQGNGVLEEDLGNGYWSNWYVSDNWAGPIIANFGPAETEAWVEWTNFGAGSDGGHQEFDIKIQKFSWHEYKDEYDHGYPTKIGEVTKELNASFEGQWASGSKGRGHINMTAWIYNGDTRTEPRCDVIIHAWDNSGNLRQKYDDKLDYLGSDGTLYEFRNIGEIEASNGLTYQVLRTKPGGIGELASYNLVPDAIVRSDASAPFETDVISVNVDVQDIMDQLIVTEQSYAGDQVPIDDDWYIHGLEWTVTGQSADTAGGVFVPSSEGRFTYNSYTIPDLIDSPGSPTPVAEVTEQLGISPNPVADSFEYEYTIERSSPMAIEIFSLNGQKLKTLEKSNSPKVGKYTKTINVSDLEPGLYIIRLQSSEEDTARKLVKY